MAELHFLRPLWLLTLLPAVLVWWRLWRQRDSVASWRRVIDPHLLEHLLVGERKRRRVRPSHVLLVIWVLTGVALAGPAWRREPSPFAEDEAGLVVLLKSSGTMNATDVQPSRLERAKHKLRDLLKIREGSSTGLIVYSGSAHVVMPLTRDDRIISTMLGELTPELMPTDGDVLAEAMGLAESLFERAGVAGSMLVITDSVSPTQVQSVLDRDSALPVQLLAVQASSAPVDAGIERVAGALRAPVVRLSVDQADVERLARRARSRIRSATSLQAGDRWRDNGYALLPLIALCALMWSRRGWVVR